MRDLVVEDFLDHDPLPGQPAGVEGAEYVVSPDMSCLMHQQGIARRARADLKYIHVAQVLNGGPF